MVMERVRAAVVGCGMIAKARHIPAFLRMRRKVELCAVCDKNEDLARNVATEFDIPKSYGNLSDMLAKEKVDIIDICVPPQIHAPIAVESIERGCHVIMEKPMALKVSDCDQMINASKKKGTRLCVIHNGAFHAPFLKAKELVTNGAIGDFVGMRIYLSTPRWDMIDLENHWYHKLPGGVVGETGPHVAYMSLEFLKQINSVDIFAKSFLRHPWAPFDEFRIELEGRTGICSAALSYTRNCWNANVDILGSEAALHLDLNRMLVIQSRLRQLKNTSIARESLSAISQTIGGFGSNALATLVRRQKLGTDVVIEGFVNSVIGNKEPPVTGEEGRETVRTMEMVVNRYEQKYGISNR